MQQTTTLRIASLTLLLALARPACAQSGPPGAGATLSVRKCLTSRLEARSRQNGREVVDLQALTYAQGIKPILQSRCTVCHDRSLVGSPAVSGGLALDSYAALKKGVAGAMPHAIYTAGDSAHSELIRRLLTTNSSKLMPKGGPPLSAAQIALFKKWIDAGAPAGNLPEETRPLPAASTAALPANPGMQDVLISTRLPAPPDLLKKEMPKEATLALALKIGPLPPVTALAYSPDGKRLAIGGYRAVTLWNTETGEPAGCLAPLAGSVQSLAFRPDGAQLAVAGGVSGVSGEVCVFDMKTLALIGQIRQGGQAGSPLAGHTDVVACVTWNADGTRLATASQDKTARLWEWPSGKALQTFRDHSDAVTRICFAPDGRSVYTASLDHNVRQFDVANGNVLKVFTGHAEGVMALAINGDGSRIVSSGSEPRLRWWNPADGTTVRYGDGSGGQVNEIVFSKDGKRMASASADQKIRLWDDGGGFQRALDGAGDWLYTVAFSPDAKFVAGAGGDGMTRVWETQTGRLRLTLIVWPTGGKTAPEWAAITPEGYFDASPAWTARLRPLLVGRPLNASRFAEFIRTLHRPENVVKSWQGAALEPAPIPAMPPKPTSTVPASPAK